MIQISIICDQADILVPQCMESISTLHHLYQKIPRDAYMKRVHRKCRELNRPLKVPEWYNWIEIAFYNASENFVLGLTDNQREWVGGDDGILRKVVLENPDVDAKLCLQLTEDVLDPERPIIAALPSDVVCFDAYSIFDKDIEYFCNIPGLGLRQVENGFQMRRIDCTDETLYKSRNKRFGRYHKNLSLEIIEDRPWEIRTLVDKYKGPTVDYWMSRGTQMQVHGDELELYGFHHVDILGVHIVQDDGAAGIGVFSLSEPDELSWDYTRRTLGNHIGSNILFAATEYCRAHGIRWLNMGFNHDWKKIWAKEERIYPGLRLSPDSTLLEGLL